MRQTEGPGGTLSALPPPGSFLGPGCSRVRWIPAPGRTRTQDPETFDWPHFQRVKGSAKWTMGIWCLSLIRSGTLGDSRVLLATLVETLQTCSLDFPTSCSSCVRSWARTRAPWSRSSTGWGYGTESLRRWVAQVVGRDNRGSCPWRTLRVGTMLPMRVDRWWCPRTRSGRVSLKTGAK